MAKILLVEDDRGLGETIVDWLQNDNFFVDWQCDGAQALEYLKAYKYDVIILDWDLPGMTGLSICQNFRQSGGKSPILFLTHRSSIGEKESGFNSGADDYLAKPFVMKELSLRIKALMRRPQGNVSSVLQVGDLELHVETHQFFRSGKEVHLSPIEFALMQFFMNNVGTVFSGDAILDRVWPASSERSPDTLRTCMRRLRLKIYDKDEESAIRTVHGVGYKFELRED